MGTASVVSFRGRKGKSAMEMKGFGNWASIKPQVIVGTSEVGKRMGQLGLAKRILTAGDDPSGQARATRLAAKGDSIETGRGNARAGIGLARTAGGALDRVASTLGRMGVLATRASNGASSGADRAALDAEFQGLAEDLGDLVAEASFGGVQLFSGETLELQVGAESGEALSMQLPGPAAALGLDDLAGASIATQDGAGGSQAVVAAALEAVTAAQAELGAGEAALKSSAHQSSAALESIARVESYLVDSDLAEARSALVAAQLRQQVAVAAVMHHGLDASMIERLLAA